nr:porin [Armatimonas sp.]
MKHSFNLPATFLLTFASAPFVFAQAPPAKAPQVHTLTADQQKALEALSKFKVSGYLQLRYDALIGDATLFKNQGGGGAGPRPTTGAPHVGGASQGFILRRGRFKLDGVLNPKDAFAFQFDFGTAGPLHMRDMYVDIKSGLPHNWQLRVGQFPPQFTYILPSSSRIREAPERALGFSDSSNANFIFKDTVSATGGTITPGTVIPFLLNQDRDQGAMFTYKAKRATSYFGLFNGEGRDNAGQRPINGNLTFMGRVEQRIPTQNGDVFVGGSRYDGQWPARASVPVGTTVADFKNAARRMTALETRWVGKNGTEVRYERIDGRYDVTPDRSLYLAGNKVHAWYATVRQPVAAHTVASLTYDVFDPTSQTVAGLTPGEYRRKTIQGGVLHQLSPGTRLRLWYVQGLTPYDPSAAAGTAARKKLGQVIGEIQVEY